MAPMAIAALVGAGMGMIQGRQQRQQQKQQMLMDAQRMRASPYGQQERMNVQLTPSMNPMMQGALAGAQFANINKNFYENEKGNQELISRNMAENMRQQRTNQLQQYLGGMSSGPMPT